MRCVIQRSGAAAVTVAGRVTGSIDSGLVVLAAFAPEDTSAELAWLARKIPRLRIFNDDQGKMNLSLEEVGGGILLISQFTLYGHVRKGTRPSFTGSAAGEQAALLYREFATMLKSHWPEVQEGEFGANMSVSLLNQGPVTLILDRNAPASPGRGS